MERRRSSVNLGKIVPKDKYISFKSNTDFPEIKVNHISNNKENFPQNSNHQRMLNLIFI